MPIDPARKQVEPDPPHPGPLPEVEGEISGPKNEPFFGPDQ